jgi:hypothetical protein
MVRVLLQFKRCYRPLFEGMYATWPESVSKPLIAYHLGFWRKGMQETRNQAEFYDEVSRGGDMPDVPLIVLTGMGYDRFRAALTPESFMRKIDEAKRGINAGIAASVAHAEHCVIEDAGHSTFHTDRPDAVVQAIRDLVNRAIQRRT